MLSLTYTADWEPITGEVLGGFAMISRGVEAAGRPYEAFLARFHAAGQGKVIEECEEDIVETGEINEAKLKTKRRKLSTAHKDDLYEALELYEDRGSITDEDVRRAYKKLVVLYHPDKYGVGDDYTEAAKAKWLKVN